MPMHIPYPVNWIPVLPAARCQEPKLPFCIKWAPVYALIISAQPLVAGGSHLTLRGHRFVLRAGA
ncbi:uncharacterized protein Dana_GF27024, isoform B [Drosophila ananassae]|uniref:Uncharacterized protein, isoform B n=1 Tax=Drosophila ananassae TaxID=7217 RepID=A0A0P9BMA8_DROAN|nr:uncharacterized protein Dana_GF27024, isoform B [Drosophila ananassae]